ncbi:hypothetical protein Hypma_001185 [Hypsizygus marmoreus]|uniref:Uncharacterized protein n=1 Tax=Hypsizygus marmoreus TaxID=39966 RepID=A0A369J6D3_HYPMA|nr:hypothetical protein Hypma_001185 [Hypsizygus marmoreus]
MRISSLVRKCTSACVVVGCLAARASAYFIINEPTRESQWMNGIANPVTWRKGVLDGIDNFDVEMARLSRDGLTLVARNVPATSTSLNIELQDVPAGDDYFLIFMNSTHGVMHATSPRFTVLAANSASRTDKASPISGAETVTVSGAPNPTRPFATTFASVNNGVLPSWGEAGQAWSFAGVAAGCLVGAAWTLW